MDRKAFIAEAEQSSGFVLSGFRDIHDYLNQQTAKQNRYCVCLLLGRALDAKQLF